MSTALHLAAEADLDRLLPLVAASHALENTDQSEGVCRATLLPLLQGSPHGAIWLIGPRRAPVGYVAVSFGWSLGLGGLTGRIDGLFIRESIRRRGMGSEALQTLRRDLAASGLKALHSEVGADNSAAQKFFGKQGFCPRTHSNLMTWLAEPRGRT